VQDVNRSKGGQVLQRNWLNLYIVKPGDSLSKIILDLYGKECKMDGSHLGRENLDPVIEAFLHNNPEIKDRNLIYPGQLLDATPVKKQVWDQIQPQYRTEIRRSIEKIPIREREKISEHSELLRDLGPYFEKGVSYGSAFSLNASGSLVGGVEGVLKEIVFELNQLDLNRGGSFGDQFVRQKIHNTLKQKIYNLPTILKNRIMRQKDPNKFLTYLMDPKKVKSTLTIPSFTPKRVGQFIDRAGRMLKHIKPIGNFGGFGIPIVMGVVDVINEKDNKVKAIVRESSGVALGVGGGILATYAICTMVFSVPTIGTSAIACGVIVGGIGGTVGAEVGEWGGNWLYELL
jgi:hypothetical protein